MDKAAKIEAYFEEEHEFKKAIGTLREIILKTPLEETFKWMFPTYTLQNKNVLAICKFKNHFGIWFFNGVFLTDPLNVLENAQEGKTKAMRHWKFSNEYDIDPNQVMAYVNEAIINQKNNRVLTPTKKSTKHIETPELLMEAFKKNAKLKKAYQNFSEYKRKEFNEYISTAKQEKTKLKRLEKILPMIEDGIGLNDKYR
ncbi:YdeI/OmpD-associated family protein [Croceivirga thetidis]|uniref:YdhG-like domain-containing protein n=1 Tax=Croceivirga thetidis TaxID=2721623 RepID=A0ABX1GSN3_9FLAO|nr:DUF1801 domain-containing protein [Croceivirga thetidis]NKI32964.1 hypothetical protein [Croceivirga thetidis]